MYMKKRLALKLSEHLSLSRPRSWLSPLPLYLPHLATAIAITLSAAFSFLPCTPASAADAPRETASATNAALPTPKEPRAVSVQMPQLEQVFASPDFAPSAVAVSRTGRIFVEFPRFTDQPSNPSVAEVFPDGTSKPYPGGGWNDWAKGKPADQAFVSTNTLNIFPVDPDALWVMDTGSPFLGKNLEGAAKVIRIDLKTNTVARVYPLPRSVLPENGYPNDLRLSPDGATAYITESGTGAILLLDVKSGDVRRVLSDTPLTKADPKRVPRAEGIELRMKDGGQPFRVHADALELSPDGKWFYYTTVDGPLYRVATDDLKDKTLSPKEMESRVKLAADIPTVGGTAMDANGTMFFSETDTGSITSLRVEQKPDSHVPFSRRTLVKDKRLIWPDAIFLADDGYLYVCAAQINRLPLFAGARPQEKPFFVYKVKLPPKHTLSIIEGSSSHFQKGNKADITSE